MSEQDLFAEQAPPPEPKPAVPRCRDCTLAIDTKHTPEVCLDWSTWRKRERFRFASMNWD